MAVKVEKRAVSLWGSAAAVVAALGIGAGLVLGGVRLGPEVARAQQVATPELPGITVAGDGSVAVRPDVALLRLGVEANAPSPTAALTTVQQGAERVLQRLRELGVAEANLQTSGLNVFAIQGPGRDAGPPAPGAPGTIYRGSITITVSGQDPARVGQLLEGAMQAGATTVHGLSFGVRDATPLHRQAIQAAVQDSRPRAEAAASAAGLTLGPVRSVVEQSFGPPVREGLGGGAGGVAVGETEIAVRVLVTYDVAR